MSYLMLFVLAVVFFNAGFIFGCWWAGRTQSYLVISSGSMDGKCIMCGSDLPVINVKPESDLPAINVNCLHPEL